MPTKNIAMPTWRSSWRSSSSMFISCKTQVMLPNLASIFSFFIMSFSARRSPSSYNSACLFYILVNHLITSFFRENDSKTYAAAPGTLAKSEWTVSGEQHLGELLVSGAEIKVVVVVIIIIVPETIAIRSGLITITISLPVLHELLHHALHEGTLHELGHGIGGRLGGLLHWDRDGNVLGVAEGGGGVGVRARGGRPGGARVLLDGLHQLLEPLHVHGLHVPGSIEQGLDCPVGGSGTVGSGSGSGSSIGMILSYENMGSSSSGASTVLHLAIALLKSSMCFFMTSSP